MSEASRGTECAEKLRIWTHPVSIRQLGAGPVLTQDEDFAFFGGLAGQPGPRRRDVMLVLAVYP